MNYNDLKEVFLHGETHADMELYKISYVKYQLDGQEYHSRERYIFGKYAATEHFEEVFNWLHNLYRDKVIADYNIGMQLIH